VIDLEDPDFAAQADRLWTNLVQLPLIALTFTSARAPASTGPALTDPAETRPASGVWTQRVLVRWRLTEDTGPAEHAVAMTFRADSGRTRLLGITETPGRAAAPVWWAQPITVARGVPSTTGARVTVLGPDAARTAAWMQRGEAAVRRVRSRLTAGVGRNWPGTLVIEVPSSQTVFERVLGVAPGRYAQIAAVTWPAGPDPAKAAQRVVVNPALTEPLDAETLAVLLTHEVVHVATRSAASTAPNWLVEGYADHLAYAARPRAQADAERDLLAGVGSIGAPRQLPPDAAFTATTRGLANSYAAAWAACRYIALRWSEAHLARLYRAVDGGADLDAAARRVLGVGTAALTQRWRQDLAARAARS
jgi:hypothetical protein